ncbi:uncharacterized protein LOC103702544 isoform X2 [Phoenix dactylifera]|uniref:Uncharacterized protein LOC103702544 isoform X2 n=1 Tax=Phoenix dactylifera TaxID=42345 RepID=A0A8B9AE63_PHODC|nr:uncharacterized protein LOC103702544 isoform X2 [Phoenix dactylifera]
MAKGRLSSRRSPAGEAEAVAAPGGGGGGDDDDVDESKTRKRASLAARLARNVSTRRCLISAFLFLLFFHLAKFISHSPHRFCASPSFESVPRTTSSVDSIDGLASEFGFLGVPWCRSKHGKTVEWTSKDLLKGLEEFVPIYQNRPVKNNKDGMGFDHSFGLWFMTRWLKPDLMIESGAFKGHSTWVLRQAMPKKPIISISPHHPEKYLRKGPAYVDKNCTYFAGKDFADFGSVDWECVMEKHGISDLSRVLVFFDDHQNALKRLEQALEAGFRHVIFDDNYDTGTGGGHCCSRYCDEARIRERRKFFWKKAVDIDDLCGTGDAWWGIRGHMHDDFNRSSEAISYYEHVRNNMFVESVLDVYWELPPVAGPSLTHQTRYDPARAPDPIIEDGRFDLFRKPGLTRLECAVFNGYTQMVYLQISRLLTVE